MKAKRIDRGTAGKRPVLQYDASDIPEKLVSSRTLLAGCYAALSAEKTINPVTAMVIVNNIAKAVELLPAHNGESDWTKQNPNPKSWKYVCNNCLKLCYMLPTKDGKPTYKFCPYCGCVMDKENVY